MSWLSKKLSKSKRKGTGVFSWGDSPVVQQVVGSVPLAGDLINAGLDSLSDSSRKLKKASRRPNKSSRQSVSFFLSDGTKIKT